VTSRDIIATLKADGWFLVACVGSHHQFRHASKPGKVTVKHPARDYNINTIKSMEKQSGLKFGKR
jgi:predicted RNA binding protein YcfA (HicA-like mRNA interferase family)